MIPEISNKLVAFGTQVLAENLQFRDAVEIVKSDRELNDLPDERLQALIQEANHYWFCDGDLARSRPENLLIYPLVTEACAETRVKAIGQFRKGVQGDAKQSLDIRMATWIGILAECLLNKGMVLLLPDDPRSPQGSYEAFLRANLRARALPDFEQLRLREVLWSAHGMWLAAMMWKESQLAQNALQERNALSKMRGRQVEAQTYIQEIEAAFHKLLEAKQRRTNQIVINREASGNSKDANKTFDYNALLTSIGNRVTAGELSIEQGKHDLLITIRDRVPNARMIDATALLIRTQLTPAAPEQAIILATLNYAVSVLLTEERAEIVRAYCALSVANAITLKGRRDGDFSDYPRAITYWQQALVILGDLAATPPEEIAQIYAKLALCYRNIGDVEHALETSHQAIAKFETLQDNPTSRINLGVAIGNLGDVWEQNGNAVKAFENHYQAFQIFIGEKDLHRVQQSLSYLTRLAVQSGRIDDAISALERTATLAQDLANIQVAIRSYLDLVALTWRIGRHQQMLEAGVKAEQLLKPLISGENPDRKYLVPSYDWLLLSGSIHTCLLKDPRTPEAESLAYDNLEKARQIAVEIQDENRLSSALIQLAKLFELTGNFVAAESYCNTLDFVKASLSYQIERDDVLGNIKLKQQQYQDAIFYLKKAIDNNKNNENFKLYTVWYTLGRAYKEFGDFSSAVQALEKSLTIFEQSKVTLYESSRIDIMTYGAEIYDYLIALYADRATSVYNPQQALFWLEKSKARTFVETIGLSVLPLHDPPPAIQSELLQESQLLERINKLRGDLFFRREERIDNFEIQQELNRCLEQLDTVLDRISEYRPEYVELRRGNVIDWNGLQSLLCP